MACDRSNELSAYHDGELSPQRVREVESHLAGCDACRRELDSLASITRRVREVRFAEPGNLAVERWVVSLSAARDRGVRRLAGWLSVAAAFLLIATLPGVLGTLDTREPAIESLSPADTAAFIPDLASSSSPTVVAARWMAADLSTDEEGPVTR